MKREFALVLETYDSNIAKVELQRSSSCEGCSICSSGKPIVLRALNNINAEKGDSVVIEVEEFKKRIKFFSLCRSFNLSYNRICYRRLFFKINIDKTKFRTSTFFRFIFYLHYFWNFKIKKE